MQEQQDFNYGIEWMDFQHRQLIEKFNQLYDSCAPIDQGGCDPALITDTVNFIDRYIGEHFALEEIYMRKTDYPEYKKHEREHLIFANEFGQLRQEIIRNKADNPAELIRKMATWIINHISVTDRTLAAYLQKKSIR